MQSSTTVPHSEKWVMNNGEVGSEVLTDQHLDEPLTYPVDAFISRKYAAAEGELLWSRPTG